MNAELLDFTRQALTKGIERPDVAKALTQAGWPDADIKAALDAFAPIDFPLPVPRPKPYLSAYEMFIYLVMFGALYVSAYSVGDLAFEFINRAFPDPLQNPALLARANDSIRWNIARLIVAFPLFLYVFRSIGNAITRDPTKRSSRPRKWLTYLTLAIAAASVAADLMVLVNGVLGGELTIRFGLKISVVAIIAGGAFGYFLTDIRKEETA
jgi:hypothetical protein